MKHPKTILIAEDDSDDVEFILDALLMENLINSVEVVRDGVEVMEYLRYEGQYKMRGKENPSVIFMDIKMPRMNGIETLKAIRNDVELKRIPIVMLSSTSEETELKTCYELGANAYVVKPVVFKDFINVITNLGVFWALTNEQP